MRAFALGAPAPRDRVERKDRQGFEKHASPEAILWHLKSAHGRRLVAESDIRWLEKLLAERSRQVVAGEWPPEKRAADD